MRAFTEAQTVDIDRALRRAEHDSGLRFSVYVGRARGEPRQFARRLHAALAPDASRAVLIFVDPPGQAVEVVTGSQARSQLSDGDCGLAAMSMATAFAVGDLAGGLFTGINTLADHAHRDPIQHSHDLG